MSSQHTGVPLSRLLDLRHRVVKRRQTGSAGAFRGCNLTPSGCIVTVVERAGLSLEACLRNRPAPPRPGPAIVVSVESQWARLAACHVVKSLGAQPVALSYHEATTIGITSVAMIHDLCPWDRSESARLCRSARDAGVPVLLYLPATGAAFASLPHHELGSGTRIQVQSRDGKSLDHLREATAAAMEEVPRVRVTDLLRRRYPNIGSTGILFGYRALSLLALGQRPSVGMIAAALRVSPRTLERRMNTEGLPPPKSLLDWLTHEHLRCVSDCQGVSIARAATAIGLGGNDLYRLKKRLNG